MLLIDFFSEPWGFACLFKCLKMGLILEEMVAFGGYP